MSTQTLFFAFVFIVLIAVCVWAAVTPKKPPVNRMQELAKERGLRIQFDQKHAYDERGQLYYWAGVDAFDPLGTWEAYKD